MKSEIVLVAVIICLAMMSVTRLLLHQGTLKICVKRRRDTTVLASRRP